MGFPPIVGHATRSALRPTWAAPVTARRRVRSSRSFIFLELPYHCPRPTPTTLAVWPDTEQGWVVSGSPRGASHLAYIYELGAGDWDGALWEQGHHCTQLLDQGRAPLRGSCQLPLTTFCHHLGHPSVGILPLTSCEIKSLFENEIKALAPCPQLCHVEEG